MSESSSLSNPFTFTLTKTTYYATPRANVTYPVHPDFIVEINGNPGLAFSHLNEHERANMRLQLVKRVNDESLLRDQEQQQQIKQQQEQIAHLESQLQSQSTLIASLQQQLLELKQQQQDQLKSKWIPSLGF